MEGRARVSEAVLASSKLTEVPRGLGDDVVEKPEDDTAGRLVVNRDIKLQVVFSVWNKRTKNNDEQGDGVKALTKTFDMVAEMKGRWKLVEKSRGVGSGLLRWRVPIWSDQLQNQAPM